MNHNDILWNHCDILWVEDFYDSDIDVDECDLVTSHTSDREAFKAELERYFDGKYCFRVDIYKYFLKLLLHLERGDIFSRYSCVVLDINLEDSMWCLINNSDDERPKNKDEELHRIVEILKDNNVRIREEHYLKFLDSDGKKQVDSSLFYKNAGYYLYLYFLQKGMPANKICMLTANSGKGNLSETWDGIFHSAGLIAPRCFDRNNVEKIQRDKIESKNKSKHKVQEQDNPLTCWLDNDIFFKEYRFYSCVVAMSSYLLDMIGGGIKLRKIWNGKKFNIDSCKDILQKLSNLSLHVPKKKIEEDYIDIIWQLVNPWEEKFDKSEIQNRNDYAYYILLKTTRNCLAHGDLKKLDLLVTSFLFGLSLRGLFDFSNIEKNDSLKVFYKEYKDWEDELLKLLKFEDKENNNSFAEKDLSRLTVESFKDIYNIVKEIKKDIPSLIKEHIGKNGKINRNIKNADLLKYFLLKSFLHGIYSISDISLINTYKDDYSDDYFLKFKIKIEEPKNSIIEIRYLQNVNRTLQK